MAQFFPPWLQVVDVHEHKLRKLVFKWEGKESMDVVVGTALIVQERSVGNF